MSYFIILEVMIHISSCKKLENLTKIIPKNMEKYMAFVIDKNLILIDSFQFMNQSLPSLKIICRKMVFIT